MGKNLIIYFSRKGENYVNRDMVNLEKGNTEYVAEFIQRAVGGDLFEVITAEPYDNNYDICLEEAKKELNEKARPKLQNYLESIDGYDNVFVCGPCWWGHYPMAIYTQLEKLNWHGKRVIPVMTHEGSGLGECEGDLKKICYGAILESGLAVQGSDAPNSESRVASWAKEMVS